MKIVYYFLLVFVICSCQTKVPRVVSSYNIDVDYVNIPKADVREMPNDTLVIAFYGYFIGDTISVEINQKPFDKVFLTTDMKSGDSGYLETIKYKDVKNLGIRINRGNIIYIEPPRRHYNIQLIYLDSIASIRFHRRLPATD